MRSPCKRKSGSACRHSDWPRSRYDTATLALRLSSPSIHHSNPRLISVGGSTTSSPASTAFVWPCAAPPPAHRARSRVSASAQRLEDIGDYPSVGARWSLGIGRLGLAL